MQKADVDQIAAWIVSRGLDGTGEADLIGGLCNRLVEAGIPLIRACVTYRTLHPVFGAHLFVWRPGDDGLRQEDWLRADVDAGTGWSDGIFYHMVTNRIPYVRRRLSEPETGLEFPIFDDLRKEGGTDYVAMAVRMSWVGESAIGPGGMLASWTCRGEDGFADDQIEAIKQLTTVFALALKGASTIKIAHSVAEAYLGRDAGRRVLRGEIQRGTVENIDAVLLLGDLQGFTKISETADRDDLIAMLNDYFQCAVEAVHEAGGQVLKFLGDGFLAIFNLDEKRGACGSALVAVEDALSRTRNITADRLSTGLPATNFNFALHLGNVQYGNIGSPERLDFTVIGPAVNEVSRIEEMCRSLERNVLASQAFAQGDALCASRLVSVGRYALRGVAEPQELFTILED